MSLTVKEINGKGWLKQKKPPGKALTPVKLFDGSGLHLLVTPNGSRGWRYRYRFGGREKLISLGVYPKTGLQRAREKQKKSSNNTLMVLIPVSCARKRGRNKKPPD